MERDELERLAQARESDRLEFKKTVAELEAAGETLCGFLNGEGGRVLIGVTSTGKVPGQDVADSTLMKVSNMLAGFEPPGPIQWDRVGVDGGREVLVFTAQRAAEARPYTFKGRAYQRVGSVTSRRPQDRYQQLLLEKVHGTRRWENHAATRYEVSALDREEILRTARLGIESGRLPESTGADVRDVVERLAASLDGVVLNAAVVLFGTRFAPDYPQCQVRLARFRGTDKSEFLDQRQLDGHVFRLLDESMLFLRRHLPVAGRIQPGLFEREDEPLFPVPALREALVNAFCHRDYSHPGGAVSVAIFDDRLEIWSDGTLAGGLRPDDLKRDHTSRPRNPIIAEVLYRRGLIEHWGRGTQKIVELCVRAGHPEPIFEEQAGSVCVRFLPSGYVAPLRVAHDLTERQRALLQMLADVERIAFGEIRRRLPESLPERTLRDDLLHLKRLGLIASRGRGRGATWYLARK